MSRTEAKTNRRTRVRYCATSCSRFSISRAGLSMLKAMNPVVSIGFMQSYRRSLDNLERHHLFFSEVLLLAARRHPSCTIAVRGRRRIELLFATHDSQQAIAGRALGFTYIEPERKFLLRKPCHQLRRE